MSFEIKFNFHCHTTFCDGKNTPEEMVLAAINEGMSSIGFSGHAHTAFDESYAMSIEAAYEYKKCIDELKVKYGDRIKIFCGLEQDLYSDMDTSGFDYVIGSAHYVKIGEGIDYVPVDETPDFILEGVDKYFGGDIFAFIDAYFNQSAKLVEKTGCDIIGHFDLITKFNEGGVMFDEADPRYIASFNHALDILIPYGVPFEINTGAMSRGYRTSPYPSAQILTEIFRRGGKIALSSDSHSADTQLAFFDEAIDLALSIGFDKITIITERGPEEIDIDQSC